MKRDLEHVLASVVYKFFVPEERGIRRAAKKGIVFAHWRRQANNLFPPSRYE